MRFNLEASTSEQRGSRPFDAPVTVELRPLQGRSCTHSYSTNTYELSKLLRRATKLPSLVIDSFTLELKFSSTALLPGIEVDDQMLQKIGYSLG